MLAGACNLKAATLLSMWRRPNLSIHGVEGAHAGPGAKTVIPCSVTGKLSTRLAAGQDPDHVATKVQAHLRAKFETLGTGNTMTVDCPDKAPAFGGNPDDFNYVAARSANRRVFGVEPDMSCSGGSIPTTAVMQATGRSVVLLPIGADDGAHSQNEKFDVNNRLAGVKICGFYLHEVARQPGEKQNATPAVPYDRCKCDNLGFKCQKC